MADTAWAALMLAPAVAALVLFRLLPAWSAFWGSLHHFVFGGGGGQFVGLSNYRQLLDSPQFVNSLTRTALFCVVVIPFQTICALGLALLLTQRVRAGALIRTLVFLPVTVPVAVAALLWGVVLQPDGLANAILKRVGIPAQPFLTSPSQALWSIVLIVSWMGVGYWTVFLIAGLRAIPTSYAEAASIDGASWWLIQRRITIPLMSRSLGFVVVANTVSNLLLFAPVQILTSGGPDGSTDLLMNEIYRESYTYGNPNQALPQVFILMLVVGSVVGLQYKLLTRLSRWA